MPIKTIRAPQPDLQDHSPDIWSLERLSQHPLVHNIYQHKEALLARKVALEAAVQQAHLALRTAEHAEVFRLSQPGAPPEDGERLVAAKEQLQGAREALSRLESALPGVNTQLTDATTAAKQQLLRAVQRDLVVPLQRYIDTLALAIPFATELRATVGKAKRLLPAEMAGIAHLTQLTPQLDLLRRSLHFLESAGRNPQA